MIRKASWDSRLPDFSSVMYLACFPGVRMAILTGVIWYLLFGFPSLWWLMMLRSFLCLLAVCMSNLEKCLCRSSDCFLIRLFDFLVLSWISWYILDLNPLSNARFVNTFFNQVAFSFCWRFPLLYTSLWFDVAPHVCFCCLCFQSRYKKSSPRPVWRS